MTGVKRATGPVAVVAALAVLVGCNHLRPQLPGEGDGDAPPPTAAGWCDPGVCKDPTMRALACDLDHLERHIDWYGSVVAKVPDVWGQARLTQYRDEFEKQMAAEVGGFRYGLQGSLARSDAAYFASATALSFAAQPRPPLVGRVASTKAAPPPLVPTQQTVERVTEDAPAGTKTTTKTTLGPAPEPAPPKAPDPVKPIDLGDPGSLVSSADAVIGTRNAARLPAALAFEAQAAGIGIEPAEYLAQKKRFLDYLAQIRRENEGDDTADSPGYSLNLMRVPVSVLPGKRTDVGFGAEITMTLCPVLGPDLLPMTFRNLLTNDVVNQLGFPLTQILNEEPGQAGAGRLLTEDVRRYLRVVTRLDDYLADPDPVAGPCRARQLVDHLNSAGGQKDRDALQRYATNEIKASLTGLGVCGLTPTGLGSACLPLFGGAVPCPLPLPVSPAPPVGRGPGAGPHRVASTAQLRASVAGLSPRVALPSLSFSNGLDNRTAVPTSQILEAYGVWESFVIGYGAEVAFKQAIDQQKYAHLPDVQGYLKEEIRAAYKFLEANPQLWDAYCTPQLVQAIRSQQWDQVGLIRQQYRKEVAALSLAEPADPTAPVDPGRDPGTKTTALGWCLIVDAALLTDRLIKDMRETGSARGRPLAGCDHWCPYFLPDPPPECRAAFNAYVALRWPIHVFALDPYVQEQNVADSLSTRREMQLALAIAFTNGQISARNMTRFVRRLEAEYQTVALNRTQVGFSHGENVFGWRFYPRFQTPDTPGNAEVLLREQLLGGPTRNQLMRQLRLEPGMRECVAVVMMPSFVPYVEVHTVSNWFPLPNPKHKVLDHTQALRLSRSVQAIRNCGGAVTDACDYRPGELQRLQVRADQLEARLPTQTLTSPVPVLNTYGGFEMFANGTTDLAPELFGWYGAPGIDQDADVTTLFLVGDHFSPLRTKVIVGNEAVQPANQTLLSRQVMQVTFGKPLYGLAGPNGREVRVHLATPYGVTRELAVPLVKQKPAPAPAAGFAFGEARLTVEYAFPPAPAAGGGEAKQPPPVPAGVNDKGLKLGWTWADPAATAPDTFQARFVFKFADGGEAILPCDCPITGTARATGPTTGEITFPTDELARLAVDLFAQRQVREAAAAGRPPALKTVKVVVTPVAPPGSGRLARSAETNDPLTVEFKLVGYCGAELKRPACPTEPRPMPPPTPLPVTP